MEVELAVTHVSNDKLDTGLSHSGCVNDDNASQDGLASLADRMQAV